MTITLRFVNPYPPYNVGERAGFAPEKASALIKGGIAVKVGEAELAETEGIAEVGTPPIASEVEPTALPEGFPGRNILADAGFATIDQLRALHAEGGPESFQVIDGIGPKTAKQIAAALED